MKQTLNLYPDHSQENNTVYAVYNEWYTCIQYTIP